MGPLPITTWSILLGCNCYVMWRNRFKCISLLFVGKWHQYSTPAPTDRVNVEGVGANEGDRVLQIVVLDSVLEVLIGHHSQSQGAHWVLAPIGQLYLQGHSVTHFTVGNDIAVTWLPIHQHIWKQMKKERRGLAGLEGGASFVKHFSQKWNSEQIVRNLRAIETFQANV